MEEENEQKVTKGKLRDIDWPIPLIIKLIASISPSNQLICTAPHLHW